MAVQSLYICNNLDVAVAVADYKALHWNNPSEECVEKLKHELGRTAVARSEDIKEIINDINENALTADGFDDALIGYTQNSCEPCRAVYDTERCIAILIEGGMTAEEATGYFEFNTLGAYVGENGPVFVSL